MDDTQKKGPQDATRVNVNEPWELRYWSAALGVTTEEIRAAVKKVGVMSEDVWRYVGTPVSANYD